MTTVTVGLERRGALDGLRGVCVLAIIADQVGFSSGRTADNDVVAAALGRLDFGLAVLFVLTGFLVYRPFAAPGLGGDSNAVRFWWRRALRVFPALWVTVAITFLLTDRSESPADWWRHLVLVQAVDFHSVHSYLPHLWTLGVAVGFYALVPAFGRVASWRIGDASSSLRRQLVVVGAMAAVAATFNVVQRQVIIHRPAHQWMPAYLDWLALGMLLAVLSVTPAGATAVVTLRRAVREWAEAPGTCWSVAAVLWLLSTTQLGTPRRFDATSFWQWTTQHLLFGMAAFFVVLPLALEPSSRRHRLLGSRVARMLGAVAYGAYLWHVPVVAVVQRMLDYRPFAGHFLTLLVVTTAFTLVCASASWVLVERPLLRYGDRPWRGKPAANAIATATTESV